MARVTSGPASIALKLIGSEIAQSRRERRWSVEGLAERAGVTPVTVRRAERGAPTVAVGTVFELAALTGVPLFTTDPVALPKVLATSRDRLALLPQRVHEPRRVVDDAF
jgi:transcriptional regulator with XRE-family HTH domain